MPKYMLLLHEDPASYDGASPEDLQKIIGEYVSWREGLMARGQLVDGQKLRDEGGRELSLVDGEVRVVDGPYSEAKEVMGGYFTIQAADYDEAVEISKGCPHLVYGKRIELRAIDEIND